MITERFPKLNKGFDLLVSCLLLMLILSRTVEAQNRASAAEQNYARGVALLERGDPAGARDAFLAVVQARADLPEAHNALGQLGELDAAIASLSKKARPQP